MKNKNEAQGNLTKYPKNHAERQLFDLLIKEGWAVYRKGWPDFACSKEGKFIVVEVKPKRSHRLKRAQHHVMNALVDQGVKAYRWTPDGGFEQVGPSTPTV